MSEIFTPAFQAKELYSRNEEVAAEAAAANSDREVTKSKPQICPKRPHNKCALEYRLALRMISLKDLLNKQFALHS